ncbi:MAG: phenylacetate--CoA ligase family protein [Deltaproteobacteria bacterium]|nr:phenylacetate--CoA ligase family protein [Deltaproteobacteria bacterium]
MSPQPPCPYWNPKTELMSRPEREALQLRKLQAMVRFAYERSPFYRRKFDAAGVHPEQIRRLEDVRRLPFTTKADLLQSQAEAPPFGSLFTGAPALGIKYHQTSGTSGRTPLRVVETVKDWGWGTETMAQGIYGFGVRADDVVYVAFAYGSFIGLWLVQYAVERIGALSIAGGGQTSEGRIRQMLDLGATTLICTPTYALRLAQTAAAEGVDLRQQSQVRKVIVSGEPGGNIPATKRALEEAWRARVGDVAGMTEHSGIFGFECDRRPGGLHILEDHFLDEVLHPETAEPLGYGERGERVTTSFGRGLLPIIRFRTGDLVERLEAKTCSCGRTLDLYRGGVLGRTDDMKIIRGVNVYPSAVEGIVRQHDEVDEFQIVLHRVGVQDEVTVKLELRQGAEGLAVPIQEAIARELAEAHEGLRMNVRAVPKGTVPRFELKSRRLLDLRHQPGAEP